MKKVLPGCVLGLLLGLWSQGSFALASVSVLLSVPEKLAMQARKQIDDTFNTDDYKVTVYALPDFQAGFSESLSASEVVLAAGRESCEYASTNLQHHPVLCVLISANAFAGIRTKRASLPLSGGNSLNRFGAIVLDQPLERQVTIASRVFPSLKKFSVLASGQEYIEGSDIAGNHSSVTIDHFNQNKAVAPQVVHALSGRDALVAIPDKNVYSKDRLRTVLLTAYGYAKPVIGYSRSYVRAGALITTFTTPEQIFRQSAEIISSFVSGTHSSQVMVYDPHYFSITHNPSIAKSLGLVRRFPFREGYDYIDKDFSS